MNKFENRFFKFLSEQDEDQLAMAATLDKGTDPAAFDTEMGPEATPEGPNSAVSKALSERETVMVNELKSWIGLMEEFLEKLNGTESSIQTTLSNAEPDTLFDKMKQSEQRKIARVATEIAALNESFKGFLAQSNNASLKYV